MIAGVGIDIVEIERLKGKTDLWKKFLSPKDFEYIGKFKYPEERVAGFWAAKEALVKAIDDKTINFNEINVAHNENGKPFFENVQIEGNLHLSISHERNYAVATVIWEK